MQYDIYFINLTKGTFTFYILSNVVKMTKN